MVRFSPDSTMLAVGGHDNYIDIYKDRNTQTNVSLPHFHRAHIHGVVVSTNKD